MWDSPTSYPALFVVDSEVVRPAQRNFLWTLLHLVISVGNGEALEVKRQAKGLSGSEFVRRVQALKKPIRIERPENLFDDFVDRIEKRKAQSSGPAHHD